MVNLKKLLSKILLQLKILTDNKDTLIYAHRTFTTGTNLSDHRVYHSMSSFGITDNGFGTNNTDYFESVTDGIKLKKAGRYFLMINGHAACKSITNYLVRIAIRVRKQNENVNIGYEKFFWDGDLRNAIDYEWSYSFTANAGENIYMQMQKYDTNNTSTTYRPGWTIMDIFYLGPE
jgi:hypothetical protein